MKKISLFSLLVAIAIVSALPEKLQANGDSPVRIYVDRNVISNGNGESWQTAFRYLQDAISHSVGGRGDEIWIAAGTYYPDEGIGLTKGDRMLSFQFPSGTKVYGSFSGSETSSADRNSSNPRTILSGAISEDVNLRSQNVCTITDEASFDGIDITGGNANSGTVYDKVNGAIMPKRTTGNTPTLLLRDCFFYDNRASQANGVTGDVVLTAIGCSFINNSAGWGSGVGGGDPLWTLINCIFEGNSAGHGGVGYWGHRIAINCVFVGNRASRGAVFGGAGTAQFINCTFAGNSGNPIFGGSYYTLQIYAANSIFWDENIFTTVGNFRPTHFSNIINDTAINPSGLRAPNIVQGGPSALALPNTENIAPDNNYGDASLVVNLNPAFVNFGTPSGNDGNFGTSDDGLRLESTSAAIGIAIQSLLPTDVYDLDGDSNVNETLPLDLKSSTRTQDGGLDLGAYEHDTITPEPTPSPTPEPTPTPTPSPTPPPSSLVDIEMVRVGNVSNAVDPQTGLGTVGYEYSIGKFEVTIAQYVAFLNSVAKSDPHGLWSIWMANWSGPGMGWAAPHATGIRREGEAGAYVYSAISPFGEAHGQSADRRPVTAVSWFSAARFINWLANGQPVGDQNASTTENGTYFVNGAVDGYSVPKNAINPNTGLAPTHWIPSIDEWYKAAYFDPSLNGGYYWKYATRSDDTPGNRVGNDFNQANFRLLNVYSVTQSATTVWEQNYLTDVGAFSASASYYGTFDQTGNVREITDVGSYSTGYYLMGGGFGNQDGFPEAPNHLTKFFREWNGTFQGEGIRVASLSEPPTPDTDQDGIPNEYETNTGLWISSTNTGTDPAKADTDGDGLDDGIETNTGIYFNSTNTGTSPLIADTNGDGITDGEAITAGFNPLTDQRNILAFIAQISATAPTRFGLFTQTHLDGNRILGQQDVISNPMSYGLYTSDSIMDLRMGGLMIQKSGANAVVSFQPQTTIDLTQPFTNNGTPITNTIPMPGNKGFIRINAKP